MPGMRFIAALSLTAAVGVLAQSNWTDTWANLYDTQTKYGLYVNETYPEQEAIVVCTQFNATFNSFMFQFVYELDTGNQSDIQTLYIPEDATIVDDESTCLDPQMCVNATLQTNGLSGNDDDVVCMYSTKTTFTFGDGAGKFTLYFSNNTNAPYYVPGWFQFALWKLDLTLNMRHPNMKANFPNSANDTVQFTGQSDNNDPDNRWWKKFGAYSQYSFSCDSKLHVEVVPHRLWFYFKNMRVSALNLGDQGFDMGNYTYPPNVCNFDYEKNDNLAVILGSVQTGFTLAFLFAYFIYLKKRGPVKVPKWIVEPAMRNAEVKPIDDAEYERRLSQMPDDATNGSTLTKRNLAANGNGVDNPSVIPDESF